MKAKTFAVITAALLLCACGKAQSADIPPITRMEADTTVTAAVREETSAGASAAIMPAEKETEISEAAQTVNETVSETEILFEETAEPLFTELPTSPPPDEPPAEEGYYMLPAPLEPEEDERIRSDYAAYVSARDGRAVTANDVYGHFYFGNNNGYMLLVMCPYEVYTDDIKEYELRYTDEDIIDPSCDCWPYLLIELPSSSFELLAYKDGEFTDIETAVDEKLISYGAVQSIHDQLQGYYSGSCAYTVKYVIYD